MSDGHLIIPFQTWNFAAYKDILDNDALPLCQQFGEEPHVGVMVRCDFSHDNIHI